ncbi:hypothetical protein H4R35_001097 [Dimargaris xerosporica]|nr:hypothetical protein H4R35_003120 [Dimargaris xerosporica]KAJ1980512.1 hypothetical protein H4R35_001097 [Dimargaris xerosporica]
MPTDTASDPRRPEKVIPFQVTAEQIESRGDVLKDIYTFVALVAAMAGVMLRFRYASWLSLFASILAAINEKKVSTDASKRPMMSSITFAVMGIVTSYMPYAIQWYNSL